MEEHKLRMFENMMRRRMFGSRRDEVTRKMGNIKKNEMDMECVTYGKKKGCMQGFSEGLMEKGHLEDLCEDRRLILKRSS
jgi:hypothetical protein